MFAVAEQLTVAVFQLSTSFKFQRRPESRADKWLCVLIPYRARRSRKGRQRRILVGNVSS